MLEMVINNVEVGSEKDIFCPLKQQTLCKFSQITLQSKCSLRDVNIDILNF